MISAFDVYLVMQMDSFVNVAAFSAVMASILVVCGLPFWAGLDEGKRYAKICGVIIIVMTIVAAILPSTKTAAAMIVLPAITSDRVVSAMTPELRELLDLTKDALRNMAGEKKAKQ